MHLSIPQAAIPYRYLITPGTTTCDYRSCRSTGGCDWGLELPHALFLPIPYLPLPPPPEHLCTVDTIPVVTTSTSTVTCSGVLPLPRWKISTPFVLVIYRLMLHTITTCSTILGITDHTIAFSVYQTTTVAFISLQIPACLLTIVLTSCWEAMPPLPVVSIFLILYLGSACVRNTGLPADLPGCLEVFAMEWNF